MKKTMVFVVLMLLPTAGYSVNWRVHMKVCNQDERCAWEQEKARDLWDKQKWSEDLKRSCKKQHTQPYWKDYIGAVDCVTHLENVRQEFRMREVEIKRKNKEYRTYRTWGGIRVQ